MELDAKTVRRALEGDREAFQELIQQIWGLVYVFVQQRVSDAEQARDLTQDTFLQAFDKRASLRSDSSFVSWVLTIASRKIIDAHRRRGTQPEVRLGDADAHPVVDPSEGPTRGVEKSEDSAELSEALQGLDDRYRAVLTLRYWSGLTPAQIARLLGEPEGTIRNRIFRAHARLRRELEDRARRRESERQATTGYTDEGRATGLVEKDSNE